MEITANAIQTISSLGNVAFTDVAVPGSCSIMHREGSGLVNLKGLTCQCRARYKVSFGGNIAVPSDGTAGPISLAISVEGEPVATTTMISTPSAVSEYNNVYSSIFLDVPKGCCYSVSVKNISDQSIDVQNANLIVERTA